MDAAPPPLPPEAFAERMAAFGPFPPAPRIAAAVSGGPDSLALVLLAHSWARARGGDVLALIADHGLRPESGREAEAVAAVLAARGIAARVLRLAVPPGARLQERARAARLAALAEAAAEEGRPWLLLGHQRSDQAETVAFRAARGSGAEGLAGIPPLRREGRVLLCRPLLDVPRPALEAVCAAAGLLPVRDPSNRDARFARARLRAALGPVEEAALAAAAAAAAARRARQEAAMAARLAAAVDWHPAGAARLDRAALGQDAVARAALARLVAAVSGTALPPPPAAVARLLAAGGGSLAGTLWRGRWLFREAALCAAPVPARHGVLWDGRWRLEGPGDPSAEIGALGPAPALRPLARGLPAAALAALPAVRRGGMLVAVPALAWPDPAVSARFALRFSPRLPLDRGFGDF
ncbi:MAG: tRNA lysidine(34) synthetase TilS [Acetobacteraceae bacterium]|nr:tRNA lysidine(34) synthetase TilS [Acetobacteraceae bacterium]